MKDYKKTKKARTFNLYLYTKEPLVKLWQWYK